MGKNAVTDFFSHYGATYENAVYLCNKYFNLPDYEEMAKIAAKEIKGFNISKIFDLDRPV